MAIFKQESDCVLTIFYIIFLLFISFEASFSATTGFSLELIHRDYSPSSPFYNLNLTFIEYFNRQSKSDQSRVLYLKFLTTGAYDTINSTKPSIIRPPFYEHHSTYMISLAIGTHSGRNDYKLHLDTGSSLTWIQCEPCDPGFHQQPPVFDPKKSPTCQASGCLHKFCRGTKYTCRDRRQCWFSIHYGDHTYSSGELVEDTFTFVSDGGYHDEEQMRNIAFGCAREVTAVYPFGGAVGILGLSLAPDSLLIQLKDVIGARFSYCFARPGTTHHGTLRFGTDILIRDPTKIQNTPILRYPKTHGIYFLKLIDISIGAKRMNFRRGMFEYQKDGKGGTIIDSGTTTSYLTLKAFEEVCNELRYYFRRRGVKEADCKDAGLMDNTLCFEYPTKHPTYSLPDMTWHFEGADYNIGWNKLFGFDEDRGYIFFLLRSEDSLTILGAQQQIDYRFIYDGNRLTLSFAPEDCSNTV